MTENLMTPHQAAEYLGLSRRAILRLCATGQVTAQRWPPRAETGWRWAISRRALDRYVAQQRALQGQPRTRAGRPTRIAAGLGPMAAP